MPLPVEFTFTQLNTQLVELDGVVDSVSGAYLNNLNTLVCKLVNSKNQVDPNFQNIALNYIANSNGVYRGVVPGAFNAPVGSGYRLIIDGSNGTTLIHLEVPSVVVVRKS